MEVGGGLQLDPTDGINITFPTKESGIYSIVSKKAFPTAQSYT